MHFMRKILALLLAAALCLSLPGCTAQQAGAPGAPASDVGVQSAVSPQIQNLVKLCKVWGYAKYHHPAFLLGRLDWDEELLTLIPQVQAAQTAEEVNALLHEWFADLEPFCDKVRGHEPAALEENQFIEADTSWTQDTEYLGEELAADLANLPHISAAGWKNGPVSFAAVGTADFSHEPDHDAAYDDASFRLLGLFRLWNAMEYYYPYLHLMDRDWEDCLVQAVPQMLADTDQLSYEETLFSLAAQAHDPHIGLHDVTTGRNLLYRAWADRYCLPAQLTEAEGKLVVAAPLENSSLAAGDVLVSLNGKRIDDIAAERRSYFSLSREEIYLSWASYFLAMSKTETIRVTVLRGEEELDLSVQGTKNISTSDETLLPYSILDGNIGLINPGKVDGEDTLHEAMTAMKNTQALIVDLRQYPGSNGFAWIYYYLVPTFREAVVMARPLKNLPGAYTKDTLRYGYDPQVLSISPDFYPYDKPIVVLINQTSMSFSEYATTVLRANENVTVIGENTVGTDGNVTYLPLPGGLRLSFTGLGVYELDGTQTQRTGITPDIYAAPTIQGITEGRDEILEAAVEYLQSAS